MVNGFGPELSSWGHFQGYSGLQKIFAAELVPSKVSLPSPSKQCRESTVQKVGRSTRGLPRIVLWTGTPYLFQEDGSFTFN